MKFGLELPRRDEAPRVAQHRLAASVGAELDTPELEDAKLLASELATVERRRPSRLFDQVPGQECKAWGEHLRPHAARPHRPMSARPAPPQDGACGGPTLRG